MIASMSHHRRRVALIVNPSSASGVRAHVGTRASNSLKRLGYQVTQVRERTVSGLRGAVRELERTGGVQAMILVGGDGLLHGVINCEPTISLGVIPTGSGNDFARSLSIPVRSFRQALARIDRSWDAPRCVDLLEVRHAAGVTRVAGTLSLGYDALVNRVANAIRLPLGPLKYQIGLIAALFRYRPLDIRARCDGDEYTGRKLLCSVALIPTIGGGIRIVPDARNTEGCFRFLSVDAVSPLRLARLLPTVATGRHTQLSEVSIRPGTHARIELTRGAPAFGYGDGEYVGTTPFEVRVLPRALRVLA